MVDRDRGGYHAFGLFIPDETPEYKAAHDEWCSALGTFIDRFSQVELILQRLLIRYAGVTDTVGRALFHSDRVAEMKDAINRVLDARRLDAAKAALEPFFAHLSVITGVRNNIVHWGGHQLESGDYIVSNLALAPIERGRGHRVSAKDLLAMTADLEEIGAALLVERERAKIVGKAFFPRAPKKPKAWLYKPRPLPPLGRPQPPRQRRRGELSAKKG